MDESEKIERVLEIMTQLKELEKRLKNNHTHFPETIAYILALINTAPTPDVTILTNNKEMAQA
jgi:nitrate reductase assembly molybdenum cofactor insertion protein NarJ